ncbi:MAG TPA: bifunctional enoyl-CoA hydratase/phosphate acetyltransferase [Bacteroidota bacterium]|nr:bifunctional enoyl-CoA hydratase/phosphate acetyltransferase [Bacteroidota bacterium]
MKTVISDFDNLMDRARSLPPKRIAVVNPNNRETFEAVVDAEKHFHPRFTLVGNRKAIEEGLADVGTGTAVEIIDAVDPHQSLKASMGLARENKVDILMKGGIDTGSFMSSVLQPESGLKMDRLLSDIFVLEHPQRVQNKLIMITDGGMTLLPDLMNKVELIRNAVQVAHALGNANPKVAILSATEFVVPKLESTIDAAALSKMNERGQIKGCVVDGPLALDNAISLEAAAEKRIRSEVAGRAEILVAANIESANSLAKSTTYFANLRLAHVIIGARIPILIPSRADKSDARLLSMALGIIMSEWKED